MIQQLLSNWLNWRCYDTVFVSNCSKMNLKHEPTHFFSLCPFLLDETYKIPLYFPQECQVNVCACARARVWGVNQSGGLPFISIVSQRSGGGVQHYTLSSPTLLSVSAELISEEGHLFTQETKREWHTASELQHFFFESGFFFNSQNCPAFIWTLTSDSCF